MLSSMELANSTSGALSAPSVDTTARQIMAIATNVRIV